jgi:hypothetical protein
MCLLAPKVPHSCHLALDVPIATPRLQTTTVSRCPSCVRVRIRVRVRVRVKVRVEVRVEVRIRVRVRFRVSVRVRVKKLKKSR